MRSDPLHPLRSPGMSRRVFVATIVGGLLAAPLTAVAQPARNVPRIGVLGDHWPGHPFIAAFRQGMRELGYTEGQNIAIEYRYAHGVADRFRDLAAELINLKVDVLVVGGTPGALSAKSRTRTVPIVFALAGDPVGTGLVGSLAHPGTNITGISVFHPEMSAKDLELLKTAVPQVSRVAILYNPLNPVTRPALDRVREAARALSLELQLVEVRRPDQLASAFSTMTASRAGALLAISDPLFGNALTDLAVLTARNRLPAIYNRREFAEAGGLMAHGPSFSDNYRRAAAYVDKILKGAKPADLPIEQPTKFELVINLKTARALGLTIPVSLLQRADQVIE
jgi:putative tryptophan/tyrosine transport system substrate-binding protein